MGSKYLQGLSGGCVQLERPGQWKAPGFCRTIGNACPEKVIQKDLKQVPMAKQSFKQDPGAMRFSGRWNHTVCENGV